MVNFHLNGDIVRCPDIKAIQIRKKERYDQERRCKYSIREDICSAWNNHVDSWMNIKNKGCVGRCSLSGTLNCPEHIKRINTGNMKKNFKVDTPNYRKMASAAHDLVKNSQYKTLFITLTLPKYKTKTEPDEKTVNQCFSKFVENLMANYNCTGYVAVRERGTDNHRLHYHLLCGLPYIDFSSLNNAWCAALSDICFYSRNAVRTTKETRFISNPGRALRYVCKYFSKSRNQLSSSRLIFMSNNLIKKPIQRPDVNLPDLLRPYKGVYIQQTSDYSTVFRITDNDSFVKFCNEFLYEVFNNAWNYPIFKPGPVDFYTPGAG